MHASYSSEMEQGRALNGAIDHRMVRSWFLQAADRPSAASWFRHWPLEVGGADLALEVGRAGADIGLGVRIESPRLRSLVIRATRMQKSMARKIAVKTLATGSRREQTDRKNERTVSAHGGGSATAGVC
jgi:hypothetical protein